MSNGYEKKLVALIDGKQIPLTVIKEGRYWKFLIEGKEYIVDGEKTSEETYSLIINGISKEIDVESHNEGYRVYLDNREIDVSVFDMIRFSTISTTEIRREKGEHSIRTPMPGKIVKVFVDEGKKVNKGKALLTMEAMKMENEIRSAVDGIVIKILVKQGDVVEGNAQLAIVKEE